MACGFKMSGGYRFLFAVELNPQAADTYDINNREVVVIRRDIRLIKEHEILNLKGKNRINLIIGGPPCEGFSRARKRMSIGIEN